MERMTIGEHVDWMFAQAEQMLARYPEYGD